ALIRCPVRGKQLHEGGTRTWEPSAAGLLRWLCSLARLYQQSRRALTMASAQALTDPTTLAFGKASTSARTPAGAGRGTRQASLVEVKSDTTGNRTNSSTDLRLIFPRPTSASRRRQLALVRLSLLRPRSTGSPQSAAVSVSSPNQAS